MPKPGPAAGGEAPATASHVGFSVGTDYLNTGKMGTNWGTGIPVPVTPEMHGHHFVVHRDGRRWATPLLVALLCLEASDIVFAIDSVPAIFALTREPFIVFTSNVFAILGLRSMYFMLGGAVERFHLLRYGLAVVLVFVGLKMVWLDAWYGGKFPIGVSLAIIGAVLAASIAGSLAFPKRHAVFPAGRSEEVSR